MAAIALSLSLFLFAVSRVLSRDPEAGNVEIALAVLAGIWLLFVIGGGFFWFRLLSFGVPGVLAYTGDDLVVDGAGLLDALGVSRVHVVGSSIGGAIAQRPALDCANHVDRSRSVVPAA